MTGAEPAPVWLNTVWGLSQFGTQRLRQLARYEAFVQQGIDGSRGSLWQGLRGQVILGTDAFAEAMRQRMKHAVLQDLTPASLVTPASPASLATC